MAACARAKRCNIDPGRWVPGLIQTPPRQNNEPSHLPSPFRSDFQRRVSQSALCQPTFPISISRHQSRVHQPRVLPLSTIPPLRSRLLFRRQPTCTMGQWVVYIGVS